MNLCQFRYSDDNLGYLIAGTRHAIAIDGGAVQEMLAFLDTHGLTLTAVTNTHTHPDHTSGNSALVQATGAALVEIPQLLQTGRLELEGATIEVHHTPGHSADSVVFHFDDVLIAGDTLFIGKPGRCFTGDPASFLKTIQWILTLPDNTRVYPGHDYVHEYVSDLAAIEPNNPEIARCLAAYDPGHVVSFLARERRLNPALRLNDPVVIDLLKARGLAHATEQERWISVLSLIHK
ncbi:hydroxyacylglutathione hydrolase family protein [Desulfosudis oleivorans]|uniref:Beta-lactamase domain protein n=1 Tax=Desulfosudis oleivorans (strain DSM 6200 / JCM 39069 / Hxd3) TaxID=96561 RepID=A8ZUX4_DESOH|nr:hydroxyacylglutathione hydrolase family protein [Desulfosudis oleivorans]ABW68064.1 beta-lactamase domain protein [Desulfosudis oleivorans Hxd3]